MRVYASRTWDVVLEHYLDERTKELREAIAGRSANDWGDYQYLCGQIRGIQVAIDELSRLREKINQDGDPTGD